MSGPLRVFLCHASQDKPAVRELYTALKNEGWIDPWLDKVKILPGQDWRMVIEKAVEDADVVIVCLSNQSVSKEGFVQREIKYAYDIALEKPEETIFLIPLRLDVCAVPRGLRSFHWVDYFGADKENAYYDLLESLKLRHDQTVRLEEEELERKRFEEQIKREAQELARKLAAEQALREKVAKQENERAKREEAEKIAREKLELEAVEKIKREKAEQQPVKKIAHPKVLTPDIKKPVKQVVSTPGVEELKEGPKKEISAKPFKKLLDPSSLSPKGTKDAHGRGKVARKFVPNNNVRWLGIGGIALLILILGGFSLNNLINRSPVATAVVSSPTEIRTNEPATLTSVPNTFTSQPIETPIPVPTLGIGSTMIGEKGEILAYVPAGEFTMGSDTYSNQQPIHTVYLDAFWIDQTEVTNKQYKACVDAGTCEPPSSKSSYSHPNYYGNPEYDDYPVINVNWDKANRYCKVWTGGDLPTEAQWEKAARGTDARTYPWGNDKPNSDLLNYNSNVGDTTAVGDYPNGKSIYGIYDMAGNVVEWVSSLDQHYPYDATDGRENLNSSGMRIVRDSFWGVLLNSYLEAAHRGSLIAEASNYALGFRCARSP